MAIYHLSVKNISRSEGRSVVSAAAYRSASALLDERLGRVHDFTEKDDVVHSEVLLPCDAPERWRDRATLWNEVEATEKRRDAHLARDLEIALPRELSLDESIELARSFVEAQFTSRGMVADLNVHQPIGTDGEPNPHAHILLATRGADESGFGLKVREWNKLPELLRWRQAWAEHANHALAAHGHDVRIDHRSLKAQGIALEPQRKTWAAGPRRQARGRNAERVAEHRAIAARNGTAIAADPTIVLDAITRQQSTFTLHDLARFVHRHSDDAEQFASVMAKVRGSPELISLGRDDRGNERFSTREMIEVENRMIASAARVAGAWHPSMQMARVEGLGVEQQAALTRITGNEGLALVVGHAGSGKSMMLGHARAAWELAGYRVRGAALSGIAAEGLEAGSGIASRTIASLEHGWAQERELLTSRDVLVIDEAGMIGSRQMERVLSHAADAGAKVVLVGDPEQLQAIEAGAAFRALAERHDTAELTHIHRQQVDWQREATAELATARTAAAIARYRDAGMVQAHGTHEEARAALVASWAATRETGSSIMLAYTREDVGVLNALARNEMRKVGTLGQDVDVTVERGQRSFAPGDRLMFLRNDRDLGVKNGTLGTIENVDAAAMTVTLDSDARRVSFTFAGYAHVDHGYAATVHKAQGATVDRAYVLASEHMDRHATYVALSRHRAHVELHHGRDRFADDRQLTRTLNRERAKDTTLDYQQSFAELRGLGSEIAARDESTNRRRRFAGLQLGRSGDIEREQARGRFASMRLLPARRPPQPLRASKEPEERGYERAREKSRDSQRERSRGEELER